MPAFSDHIQANPMLNQQVMQGALQGMPDTMRDPSISQRFMDDFSDQDEDEDEEQNQEDASSEVNVKLKTPAATQEIIAENLPIVVRGIVGELAQTLMDQLQQELDNDINNADLGEIANLANISTALNHQLADFDAAAHRRAQSMMGGLSEGVGEESAQAIRKPSESQPEDDSSYNPLEDDALADTADSGAPTEGSHGGPSTTSQPKKPYSPAEMAPSQEEALGEQLGEEGGEGGEGETGPGGQAGGAGGDAAQQAAQSGQLQQDQQGARGQNRQARGAQEAVAATEGEDDPEIQEARQKLDRSSGRKTEKGSGAATEKGVHEKSSAKDASKNLTEKLAASIPSSMLKNPEIIAILAVSKDMVDLFGADDASFKLINVAVSILLTANYMNQGSYFQRMFYKRFLSRFMIAVGSEFIPGLDVLPSYTIMALYIWYSSEKESKRKASLLEKVRGVLGKAKLT